MKNNKLIILIVVGILLITGVTIFTLTRNKVAATMNTCTSGHTYVTGTSYEDLKDGTHKKTCTVCGYSTTEEHFDYGKDGIANSGSNGICDKCGICMNEHVNKTFNFNDDYHWYDCENCGTTEINKVKHIFNGTSPKCTLEECPFVCPHLNQVGTTCSKCGMKLECEHKFTKLPLTGKCNNYENCGYECPHTGQTGEWCNICGVTLKCTHKFTKRPATGKCDNYENCGYECSHTGVKAGKVCDTCGMTVTCEHKAPNGPTIVVEATCTRNGYEIYYCANGCGYSERYTIDALEHDYNSKTYAPTCTTRGYTEYTCENCGDTYTGNYKNATGHTEPTSYKTNGTYHWKECSDTTCNEVIGDKETHIDNNKDGKCDVCTYTMSSGDEEECTHPVTERKLCKDETEHWIECEKCGEEIEGTREKHKYINGECACGKECEHKNTTPKSDDTYHWDECDVCGEKLNNEEHSYKDGECECGKEEDKKDEDNKDNEEECTHANKECKSDEDEHWQVCKECGEEIEGTRKKHTYENGECTCGKECEHKNTTPKSDDTYHWDECNVCGEKLNNEEHSYKDGECECGKDEDKKECEHTNKEWKADKDEHWQVCKECGKEIEGTRGKHVDVDGKCKNCGLKDSTSSTTTLPNTGIEENMQIAVMITLAILGSALLIKLSREE